ncbi:MAG: DUF433 domain-containing protein [Vulcanimicrobiota bacterium]
MLELPSRTDHVHLVRDSHGGVRIGKTRVSLDSVVHAYLLGATAEGIAEQFPSLGLADVHSVLGFYLRHRDQVDAYLAERQAEGQALRENYEQSDELQGYRQRLLARQAQRRGK